MCCGVLLANNQMENPVSVQSWRAVVFMTGCGGLGELFASAINSSDGCEKLYIETVYLRLQVITFRTYIYFIFKYISKSGSYYMGVHL